MKRRLSGGKMEGKRGDVGTDERHWQLLLSRLLSPQTAPAQRQREGCSSWAVRVTSDPGEVDQEDRPPPHRSPYQASC